MEAVVVGAGIGGLTLGLMLHRAGISCLREFYLRAGDRPFDDTDRVIGRDELVAMSDGYKRIAGYDRQTLARRR